MEETHAADRNVEEVTSLCMRCHEDGTTRLLLTKIPFFREIVIMSFSCPHCNFRNSEIQSAGEIQQRGVCFTFRLDTAGDLQRQIVKSDTCVTRIESLELELPAGRGQLTNIEGLLSMVKQDLEAKQDERRVMDHGLYSKLETVIQSLARMLCEDGMPFTLTLDDPAGNSSIEPSPDDRSGKYVRNDYPRTTAQNAALGFASGDASEDLSSPTNGYQQSVEAPATEIRPQYHPAQLYPAAANNTTSAPNPDGNDDFGDLVENEVYAFPTSCPGCSKPCVTNMKMVRIPNFDEVVIMATVCEYCGYRTNEVKSGGKIPERGRRITLKVLKLEDLSRDILKAESCSLQCPELNLTVEPGTLGGRFTTVEGLLTQVRDDLRSSIFDIDTEGGGDSMAPSENMKWTDFFRNLNEGISGEKQFTVILEDPLAGSYVQSLSAPDPDEQITMEEYERTEEEEEHLGLRDIKIEGYSEEKESSEMKETIHLRESNAKASNGTAVDATEVAKEVKARLDAMALNEESEDR